MVVRSIGGTKTRTEKVVQTLLLPKYDGVVFPDSLALIDTS